MEMTPRDRTPLRLPGWSSTCLQALLFCWALSSNPHLQVLGLKVVSIDAGVPIKVTVPTQTRLQVQLDSIPSWTHHIVFQAHSWFYPMNVSLTPDWTAGSSAEGHDVGLVTIKNPALSSTVWFVNTTGHKDNVTVLMAAHLYNTSDPVPGGCNTEMALEDDPNVKITYAEAQNKVQFAYADKGTSIPTRPTCEITQLQSDFHYEVYYKFLEPMDLSEDTYLSTIQELITAFDVESNATKFLTLDYQKSKTEVPFAAYRRHGVAYTVVVRDSSSNCVAAYVPAISYGCSMDQAQDGYCFSNKNWTMVVLECIAGVCGLFVCFFGHRFFKMEMIYFGFWAFALLCYILVARFTNWDFGVDLALSGVAGVIGGGLWWCMWHYIGFPTISVLLPGFVMGYSVAAVAFNYTPLGNLSLFMNSFNYGMAFTCALLLVPVILLVFTKQLNMLSCALVGGLFVVLAADEFISVSFSYFLGNSINKAIIPSFIHAYVIVPIQTYDIVLIVAWVVLTVLGIICQSLITKNRPSFPPCRVKERREQRRRELRQHPQVVNGEGGEPDERSPLLPPSYNSIYPTAPIEPPLVGDL